MSEKEYENKKELNNKQLEQVSGGGFEPIPKLHSEIKYAHSENKYGAVGDMKKDPA